MPSGSTHTVSVTFDTIPREQQVNGIVVAETTLRSYEIDPDPGNNGHKTFTSTFCSSWVESSSTVHPEAKVATSGCTYIGDSSVIGAKATIGQGVYVSGADVGTQASIGQGSSLGTFGLRSKMGPKSSIGTSSYIQGEIGESAKIGDRVAGPLGLVVEAKATVGSGTSFEFSQPGTRGVRILSGAKVPANTVITEQYCLSHPKVCAVTG